MGDKILRRNYIILRLKINLFTLFGINLGGGDTVSYVDCTDLFSFVGGKYEPSGWLSTEIIAFKI